MPSQEIAVVALESALQLWRSGGLKVPASRLTARVETVDSVRKSGRILAKYEILGAIEHPSARSFAVRLWLDQAPEPQVARYLVFGKDPVWVFRQEDYELISHWEHKMDAEQARGDPPSSKAGADPEPSTPPASIGTPPSANRRSSYPD